jgi:hypothetical protein
MQIWVVMRAPTQWRSSGVDSRQTQEFFKMIEVPITVQQGMAVPEAKGGNETIDPNVGLGASLDQQPEARFDGGPFCPRSATPHRLAHQAVVDINIGAHRGAPLMCKNIRFLCRAQS